ncbi:hypothetical protein VPBG_00039 [Vibrio phage helene 12B3]|uniref:hypothetical protein n=1 Tax=Vibrio phage helene 12B3 TaxID=573173 RepID=UPI0002C0582B|nr:hypothetical protein VPBG_00039 [Vibrio phage helene 12B3]AGG57811.1 hypothetical protein VPBG_00039 [Vibrio phage helene 12B3]
MMNKLHLAILTLLISGNVYAIDHDKKLHLGVSTAIGAFTQYQVDDWKNSMAVCGSVGLVKEVVDEVRYGGFDTEDLAYDMVGCSIGVIIGDYGLTLSKEQDTVSAHYEVKF